MHIVPIKEAADDSTYRVEFIGGMAHIECFGLTVTPIAGLENGEVVMPIAEIPDWLERRVAVLCTMSYEPPTEFVNKIGRRISQYVYWIFYEGEDDGTDTGEEG